MRNFTKLIVWQRAETLAEQVDDLIRSRVFGRSAGLADQLDRAACAIGALIAEGAGAATRRHYATYLDRAAMSANEVEHHLRQCFRRRVIDASILTTLIEETGQIRRMLIALRRRVLEEDETQSRDSRLESRSRQSRVEKSRVEKSRVEKSRASRRPATGDS